MCILVQTVCSNCVHVSSKCVHFGLVQNVCILIQNACILIQPVCILVRNVCILVQHVKVVAQHKSVILWKFVNILCRKQSSFAWYNDVEMRQRKSFTTPRRCCRSCGWDCRCPSREEFDALKVVDKAVKFVLRVIKQLQNGTRWFKMVPKEREALSKGK